MITYTYTYTDTHTETHTHTLHIHIHIFTRTNTPQSSTDTLTDAEHAEYEQWLTTVEEHDGENDLDDLEKQLLDLLPMDEEECEKVLEEQREFEAAMAKFGLNKGVEVADGMDVD